MPGDYAARTQTFGLQVSGVLLSSIRSYNHGSGLHGPFSGRLLCSRDYHRGFSCQHALRTNTPVSGSIFATNGDDERRIGPGTYLEERLRSSSHTETSCIVLNDAQAMQKKAGKQGTQSGKDLTRVRTEALDKVAYNAA
ncbi:hypothetical protein Tco_1291809 [Tanacetum coccineum]